MRELEPARWGKGYLYGPITLPTQTSSSASSRCVAAAGVHPSPMHTWVAHLRSAKLSQTIHMLGGYSVPIWPVTQQKPLSLISMFMSSNSYNGAVSSVAVFGGRDGKEHPVTRQHTQYLEEELPQFCPFCWSVYLLVFPGNRVKVPLPVQ